MNSKQTDNSQQKKTMPEDWSPVPSVERKPSTPKSNNENKEELLKEFLGMEDSNVVDIRASKESANRGIGQSIQTEDRIHTKDSLQTEPVIDTGSTVSVSVANNVKNHWRNISKHSYLFQPSKIANRYL